MKCKKYTLKELATIKYGKNQAKVLSATGSVPIYGTGGIMGYASTFLYDKASVLIGRKGSIGKVKYVEHPFWTVDTLFYTEINQELVLPRFLYYLLSQYDFNQYNEGTTIPSLRTETLNRLEYSIPPIPTQRKITAILTSLDDKIENNSAICKKLEDQALICFCQTFIESASNKASRPIYEFAEFINGSSFRQSELTHEGLPIIKIVELKAGISATTLRYSGDISKKVLINDGDILFSWSGNPQTSIDVFIWCGGSGVLNQHIFKVKSLFDCPWFTYLLLKYLMPQFVSIASDKQTTGLGHVTAGDLKRLKFPHDLGKMQSFESTIAPIMLGVYNSMLENVKLLSLRDTLLPKLMRGEIGI